MFISKLFKNHFLLLSFLILIATSNIIKQLEPMPKVFISKEDSTLNINSTFLDFINLGHKRLLSSLFWVATILESDEVHYKSKDLNSWMFVRFNTIRKLEPNFLPTYTFGGPYLSIVKDDLDGASFLYNKGLEIYPNNYGLLKNAAFHFHFEVEDRIRSRELFNRIVKIPGANKALFPTLARLETENGNLDFAFKLMFDQYSSIEDKNSLMGKKVFDFLYSIKAEKDLSCLNARLLNCSVVDLENHPYVNRDGQYYTIKEWKPFRVRSKK